MSTVAYIGLGANLGEAAETVNEAIAALGQLASTKLVGRSALYRTAPVGYLDQPDFINAVAAVETTLSAHALLDGLLSIEAEFGRQRTFRNAPRTLDLDVLLYGNHIINDERLIVPHPRMQERAFVLVPLADIAPNLILPSGHALSKIVAECDQAGIKAY